MCNSCIFSAYFALQLKDRVHIAQCLYTLPWTLGFAVHHAFALVFSSEYMLLLVAGGYLIAIPPYLIAEWLSNKRSFSRCLVSPDACHQDDTPV